MCGLVIGTFEPDLETPPLTPDLLLQASRDTDSNVIITVPSMVEVNIHTCVVVYEFVLIDFVGLVT